jgi:ketosteroid isomerase-like protein
MSQKNVEVVRGAWRSFNERGIDASLDYFAEDCVGEDVPELPDRATYEGREGLRERYWHFVETWGDFAAEPVEFIVVGDDVVVAVIAMRGRGKGSDAPFDFLPAFVYEVRDGRIVRDRPFMSRSQALEAAGLEE